MSFASWEFLALLFATVALYWALPWARARLSVLLIASFVFYGWRHWPSLAVLGASIVVNWWVGRRLEVTRSTALLRAGIALNLSVLVYFKYAVFFVSSLNSILRSDLLPLPVIETVPLGVSFFTFQVIAYLVDVWRAELAAERSLLVFGVFKSFFAQLIAGPVVKGKEFLPQLRERQPFRPAQFHRGLFLVLLGLGLKMSVADFVAPHVAQVWSNLETASSVEAWLAFYGFSVQLFADFWGYSTVALGIGCLFGFELPKNFALPYLATSHQDFWRRWHITLSRWFRDYVYIPLGGNRRRPIFSRMTAMTLAGLWHGASWNFVLWGALHGAWGAIEARVRGQRAAVEEPARHVWLKRVLVFHGVSALWILFHAPTMRAALSFVARLFQWPLTSHAIAPEWPLWIFGFLLIQRWLEQLTMADGFAARPIRRQLLIAATVLWLVLAYAGPPADFAYYVY